MPVDFRSFEAMTFDCYGTLIDWETGLLTALRPIAADHDDDALLEAFARHESALEDGPYLSYREVLAGSLRGMGADLGFEPTDEQVAAFADSVGDWPAFPDSPGA